jgi:hypothetical protein
VASTVPAAINLGFLQIVHEPSGYMGGYLVTNAWGRPVEFRLSTAVQPNRVQQILYGGTLQPYICADLIGKTLVEKTGVAAQLIFTDCVSALELRERLEVPVLWLAAPDDPAAAGLVAAGLCVRPAIGSRGPLVCHPRHPEDLPLVKEVLERIEGLVDPVEPFTRIREAMTEARKMGVTKAG